MYIYLRDDICNINLMQFEEYESGKYTVFANKNLV